MKGVIGMKKHIGIILLSAVILIGGCKVNSAGDGVNLVMDTAEAESVPEALTERNSSEVCPETTQEAVKTAEEAAKSTGEASETAEKTPETSEKSIETAWEFAETQSTNEEVSVKLAAQAEGYVTETSRFSGTLTGSFSTAAKLEVEIDVPFGKQCIIDRNGRVTIPNEGWHEDDTVYAYFADYEYYTEDVIAEFTDGFRDEESLYEMTATKEQTDSGEDFYI